AVVDSYPAKIKDEVRGSQKDNSCTSTTEVLVDKMGMTPVRQRSVSKQNLALNIFTAGKKDAATSGSRSPSKVLPNGTITRAVQINQGGGGDAGAPATAARTKGQQQLKLGRSASPVKPGSSPGKPGSSPAKPGSRIGSPMLMKTRGGGPTAVPDLYVELQRRQQPENSTSQSLHTLTDAASTLSSTTEDIDGAPRPQGRTTTTSFVVHSENTTEQGPLSSNAMTLVSFSQQGEGA
ncbi:unnamed protein product, partial [Amoebophrya sp. A25]